MDQLGELVRLNDDKLYSQLINYKYRGKTKNTNGQVIDEDDDLENEENKSDNKNIDKNNNLYHHHRHRKNRIKLNRPNPKVGDNVNKLKPKFSDKLSDKFKDNSRNKLKYKFKDKQRDSPTIAIRLNEKELDENPVNINAIINSSENNRSSLVIDLDMINKSDELSNNQKNDDSSKKKHDSDELKDYEFNIDEDKLIDNSRSSIKVNNFSENNLTNNFKDELNDYDNSIEIIDLTIDGQTNNELDGQSFSNITSNEYIDSSTNLLISSSSNRLVLDELNQTDWILNDNEKRLKKFDNETNSLDYQSDGQQINATKLSEFNTDSNEGEFIYELDLLDNGAVINDDDYNPTSNRTDHQQIINHQFMNQQLIIDNKFINQHNQLIDSQYVDQNRPKIANISKSNLTANATIIATMATFTNKFLLNMSAPNQVFTSGLTDNITSNFNSSSINLPQKTEAPFSYWLTILIAVLIGIASIITIIGNLLVSFKLLFRLYLI